jgi:hypothetical protein
VWHCPLCQFNQPIVSDQGSVVGFTPMTEAAKAFLTEKVAAEPWQFLAGTLWVDHHMVANLIEGIESEGLSSGSPLYSSVPHGTRSRTLCAGAPDPDQ